MEIFGVGTGELVLILVIMLIVVGPKRMIHWAYILGQYTAKLRAMWAETMSYVEKEFREAGMDVELPKDIPTRGQFNRQLTQQIDKALTPVTKPMQDVLDETKSQVNEIKSSATISESNGYKAQSSPESDLGTWSSGGKPEE
jgi:sec-independent protein translocase protein TatB